MTQENRLAEVERRQDRLESEVSSLVKAVDGLTDKLSGFLREYNQRSRTDWKLIVSGLGVMVTVVIASISAASATIFAFESERDRTTAAALQALAAARVEDNARQTQIDNRIIDDYRREADALARRLDRLEAIHMQERTTP